MPQGQTGTARVEARPDALVIVERAAEIQGGCLPTCARLRDGHSAPILLPMALTVAQRSHVP
jgi:hypothetical protein